MPVRKKGRLSPAAALAAEINATLNLKRPMMTGADPYFRIHRIPTGSLVMDRITGGGFALGRHYELYGDENAGKSYILYRALALSQQRGNLCALIDPEHSFDGERFEYLGGDPDELLLEHPTNAEEAVAVMMLLAQISQERKIEIVGLDSVASLVPNEEMSRDVRDEDRIGGQARMMSRALRRITTVNEKTLFVWTNQERTDIGIRFGNPRTTSGGRALRYYATGRIEFRKGGRLQGKRKVVRAGKLIEAEVTIGRWVGIKVEKDKSQRPGREGSFVFDYDLKMVHPAYEIIHLGLEDRLIERSANGRYSYVDLDDHEWKGTEKQFVKILMREDELREELVTAIADTTRQGGYAEEEDDG